MVSSRFAEPIMSSTGIPVIPAVIDAGSHRAALSGTPSITPAPGEMSTVLEPYRASVVSWSV